MEQLILLVIIGLFFLVNALIKKALNKPKTAKQSSKPNNKGGYEASSEDIEEFMDNVNQKKKEADETGKGQKIKAQNAGKPLPKSKKKTESSEKSKTYKTKKEEQKPEARKPTKKLKTEAEKGSEFELDLGVQDLQNAVVMSEILRPPVTMRGRPGHKPPVLRDRPE